MNSDLLYQLSLSNVEGIGPVYAKALCDKFETARDIFNASRKTLERIDGIGSYLAGKIKSFNNFRKAEKEIAFIERYGIQPLFIKDKNYPRRLLNCDDPPTLLFYKGNADLNSSRIISVVGTRRSSEYGKDATEKIIKELSRYDVLIISGLAFGIDAIAHKAALNNNLKTVGVIAHGMDIIYPPENKGLAKEMITWGGILTEFTSFTKPDKFNFPSRNRIVAGLSDATIVIESSVKGGSMITAEIAEGYHKDVFAVPGRITESRSEGCNRLIRDNKAAIISDPKDILATMGWDEKKTKSPKQRSLFIELDENEKMVMNLLRGKESLTISELSLSCGMPASTLASTLLNLELNNMAQTLPGKRYRLVG